MAVTADKGVVVGLTQTEVILATWVGTLRYNAAGQSRLGAAHGFNGDGLIVDIDGALCECAVAKWANVFWSGTVGEVGGHDAGRLQVRGTRHPIGKLILHPTDPDDRAFILVVNDCPTFKLVGWIYARDGKRQEWWADPTRTKRPAFFVPHGNLAPMAMLDARDAGTEAG